MIETFEMKPNFTYLGKKYDLDPRTIKKYYQGYNGKATTRAKPSMLDEYKDIIKNFSSNVFWIQNDIWRKIIWDDVKKSMIMGNAKLIELIFLYSYDSSILTEAEKKKIVKELESKWDYHESDIMEIFLSRLSGSDYAHK